MHSKVIKVIFSTPVTCYDTHSEIIESIKVRCKCDDGHYIVYELVRSTLAQKYGHHPDLKIWYLFKEPKTGRETTIGITAEKLEHLIHSGSARIIK